MNNEKPETFGQYFNLQIKKLREWVTPDPFDSVIQSIFKTILKSIAVLVLLILSPVLLLGLTLAFFATF